mgnify:CR=1 FL=1
MVHIAQKFLGEQFVVVWGRLWHPNGDEYIQFHPFFARVSPFFLKIPGIKFYLFLLTWDLRKPPCFRMMILFNLNVFKLNVFDLFKLNVFGFDVYLSEDLIWFSEAVGVNSRRSMFVLGVGGLLDLHKNSINQNAVFVIHIVMFQHG